jgi:hypothetical protein
MTDPANLDVQAIIKEMEKFHPLVLEVCVNLQEDGDVSDEGIQKLKKGLAELGGTPEFVEAVEELLRACWQWDTLPIQVDPTKDAYPFYQKAARKVLAVLNSSEMKQLHHQGSASMTQEHGEKRAKLGSKFSEFKDDPEGPKAPKVGEEKPEGAIDLNALKFPKRL